MKKVVFEIVGVVAIYLGLVIYEYYNGLTPGGNDTWIVPAIIVVVLYLLFKLPQKRKNKK